MKNAESHFKLLTQKNFRLLIRNPLGLFLEFLFPLLVLLLFFGISLTFSPTKHCFATFQKSSNVIPLPPTVTIAVAPSTQLSRDIINHVISQNVSVLTHSNFQYASNSTMIDAILKTNPNFYQAAVLFNNFTLGDSKLPHQVNYTIRYPQRIARGSIIDWTGNEPGPYAWRCSSGLGFCLGSKTPTSSNDFLGGQVQLQTAIDKAIIYLKTGKQKLPETAVRQLPYPQWTEDWFAAGLSEALPLMIIICYFWNVFITTRDIVTDRDNGVREVLKSLGVSNACILASWYVVRITMSVIVSTYITVLLWAFTLIRYSNLFIVWLILVFYSISLVNMCFLLGTFTTSTTLGMFGILIAYNITFTPFLVVSRSLDDYSETTKFIISLLSPTASSLALSNVGNWESLAVGVNWVTMSNCVGPIKFTVVHSLIMMAVDCFIYGLLFVYFDGIYPGKHGIGLPWNYVFQRRFWSEKCGEEDVVISNVNTRGGAVVRGIEVKELEKTYSTTSRSRRVHAVNGITTHFREGEISTLLGYNGSGKTTTLKMLAAMHKPTKGEITVNGLSLSENMHRIRKTLGYCPQYNILIENLTVKEHLDLFVSLKGLTGEVRRIEVDNMVKKLSLDHKCSTIIQHLSGGMKRKLCLGMALCGHPKVIVLDEPTCGMDTESKKVTWDILLGHKEGRTIIVSTHDMEEADLLSDRCFVLSEGQIVASGSSLDIKSREGLGYHLSLTIRAGSDVTILPILQRYAPEARLVRRTFKEQVFHISEHNKPSLIALFRFLEKEGDNLGIDGHGLTQSDLEEALVNVVRQTSQKLKEESGDEGCLAALKYALCGSPTDELETVVSNRSTGHTGDTLKKYPESSFIGGNSEKYTGFQLGLHRLNTLLKKRALDTCRHRMGILLKLVIPSLLVMFSMIYLKTSKLSTQYEYRLNTAGLDKSRPDQMLFVDLARGHWFTDKCPALAKVPNLFTTDWTSRVAASGADNYTNSDCCSYSYLQLNAQCSVTSWNSSVWKECGDSPNFGYKYCNETCLKREPLRDYQGCEPGRRPGDNNTADMDYFMNMFMAHSHDYTFQKYDHTVLSSELVEGGEPLLTAWYSPFRYHGIAASMNMLNNMLLSHYTNHSGGEIYTTYWPFQTLGDSLTQAASVTFPLLAFSIFTTFAATFVSAGFCLFLVNEKQSKMKHLQLMSGITGRIYWYANLLWDLLTYTTFTLSVTIIIALFNFPEYSGSYLGAFVLLVLSFGFVAIPLSYLFTKWIQSSVLCFATICTFGFTTCVSGVIVSLYIDDDQVNSLLNLLPHAALSIGIVDIFVNYNTKSYSAVCTGSNCPTNFADNPLSVNNPGVGAKILFMIAEGCMLIVLVIMIEELTPLIQLFYQRKDVRRFINEDSDVSKERRLIREKEAESFPVIINSISKVFTNKLVVNNVSFAMKKRECVGLLGHNGAGKSTLFSILSGETIPTYGGVSLLGTSMVSDLQGYRQSIGYCPQDGTTFTTLTGREILQLFGGLRGLRKEKSEEVVTKLLNWTGLTRYADSLSGTYSGGTLKKLSLAVALIGDPPVLLLDEPSASVDPSSRRVLWKLLRQLIESGKSVLVSSHIKGEVEAICDKVVVLNEGDMIAVGQCVDIRNKFGPGFCLQVSTKDAGDIDITKAALEKRLKAITFVHRVGRHLQYFVPRSTFSYADIFIAVELLKHLVNLDHYSVSQLSFEQLNFKKILGEQEDNVNNLGSFLRKLQGFVNKRVSDKDKAKRGQENQLGEIKAPLRLQISDIEP